jgi:exosortase
MKAILFGEPPQPDPVPAPAANIWNNLVYAGLFFSLLCFALGAAMRAIGGPSILATFFNSFGFVAIFLGMGWIVCEKNTLGRALGFSERWDFIKLLVFPALVWLISGPFLYLVDTNIKIILLREVTSAVVTILSWVDMNVVQEGNVIILPTILDGRPDSVGVADACSGIRSLTACIFMGAFLSAIFVKGTVRKIILLCLSALFAIVLNILRTSFLTLWAFKYTSRSLDWDLWGHEPKTPDFLLSVHDLAGYVAMGITFLILIAILPLINLRFTRTDEEMQPVSENSDEKTKD